MSRHTIMFFACLLVLISLFHASAETTPLESEVIIQSSGSDLDVGATSAPTVADWDNDGDGDLIVGMSSDAGRMYLFENVGTDEVPVFEGFVKLKSSGSDIRDPDC